MSNEHNTWKIAIITAIISAIIGGILSGIFTPLGTLIGEILFKTKPETVNPKPSVDYSKLEVLLQNKKYREADDETRRIMYQLSGLSDEHIGIGAMNRISCNDIRRIDSIWRTKSNDKFGFSVQREIYIKSGNNQKFGDSVGWRKNGKWLTVDDLEYTDFAPRGHLPTRSPVSKQRGMSSGWLVWSLLPNNSSSICLD